MSGRTLMFQKRSFLIAALIVAVIVVGGFLFSRSWLRSEASIQRSLLKQAPLGTSSTEVLAFIRKEGWEISGYDPTRGFLKQDPLKPNATVGDSHVQVHLGYYWLPFRTDVTAFWGFDKSNRLIDVWVWKTIDAL